MRTNMQSELELLLNDSNFAQFATVNEDGSPHIDTVWFGYQQGQLVIATTMATKKAKNISVNNNGYVVVTNKANPYEQAQIKVRLAAIESDESMAICDSISLRYIGKQFPQRHHLGRVAIFLSIVSARYHRAKV